jgi:hypothetical protein
MLRPDGQHLFIIKCFKFKAYAAIFLCNREWFLVMHIAGNQNVTRQWDTDFHRTFDKDG